MKGLELQETSCHTEEAGVIKDIFSEAAISGKHTYIRGPITVQYFTILSCDLLLLYGGGRGCQGQAATSGLCTLRTLSQSQ